MTALTFRDIRFSYDGKRRILDGISLDVERGRAVAITGRSGSGKSTLAMVACGVIPKSVPGAFSGTVEVFGEDIRQRAIHETARQISMVFQDPEAQLFAPSAADEVAFAPENLCYPPGAIEALVDGVLASVGMRSFKDHPPSMLSGGQQQLIALASILALGPEIVIFDEVTAQIGEEDVRLIRSAVQMLKAANKTVIVIEHGYALRDLCDALYRMENGRIERQ